MWRNKVTNRQFSNTEIGIYPIDHAYWRKAYSRCRIDSLVRYTIYLGDVNVEYIGSMHRTGGL